MKQHEKLAQKTTPFHEYHFVCSHLCILKDVTLFNSGKKMAQSNNSILWQQVWQKGIATGPHFQLHEQYTYYLFSYNSSCSSPQLMMWCIVFYSSQDANWAFKVVPLLLWGGWFILGICWNTTTLLVSSAVWLADCLFQTMVCHYDLVSMIGKVSSHNCWLHLLYHDCKQYDSYKACLLYQ